MEKINVKKIAEEYYINRSKLEDALFWAFCELMDEEDIEKACENKITEVEVKVNGREVKFSKLIKLLMKGYEKAVDEEAKKIIDNVVFDIENKIEDMVE